MQCNIVVAYMLQSLPPPPPPSLLLLCIVYVREMNLSWEIVRLIISVWNIVHLLFAFTAHLTFDLFVWKKQKKNIIRRRGCGSAKLIIIILHLIERASLMNYVVTNVAVLFFVEAALFTWIRHFFVVAARAHFVRTDVLRMCGFVCIYIDTNRSLMTQTRVILIEIIFVNVAFSFN